MEPDFTVAGLELYVDDLAVAVSVEFSGIEYRTPYEVFITHNTRLAA